MITPGFKFDKRFKNRVMGRYERFIFETGVADKAHRKPRVRKKLKSGKWGKTPQLGTLDGGPIRKMQQATQSTNQKIAIRNEKRYGFMTKPFKKRTSKDLRVFIKAMFHMAGKGMAGGAKAAVTKALLAVVKNPMLKGAYGRNTRITKLKKGFNRLLFDTGQLYKSLRAKVRVKRVPK